MAIHDIKFSLKHALKPEEKLSVLLINEALFYELLPFKSVLSVARVDGYAEERAIFADSILKSERKKITLWASLLDSGISFFKQRSSC